MKRSVSQSTLSLALATAAILGCDAGINKGEVAPMEKAPFLEGITPGVRESEKVITDSSVDYGAALRTAALKLTDNYPTLAEIKELQYATDPQKTFAARIDTYLADPRFAFTQRDFWSDTFKMGGQKTVGAVALNMDAAPTYAASLVVGEQPITNLFTATKGTCLTLTDKGAFAAGACPNMAQPVVGVLSDPGVQAQFYSSMAFRRTRWIQETFVCNKFPAEYGSRKEQHPGGVYASPWEFTSISGGKTAKVDFRSDDSLICANCHTTMNHIAPILGKYDEAGLLQAGFAVHTPVAGSPITDISDWLPAGQQMTAWRFGKPAADLPALGQAIAADPDMARCVATRVWNWAMSRGDAVVDQANLTPDLADELAGVLKANNYNVKKLIRYTLTSSSFVRY